MKVAGVDGCRRGWVAVVLADGGFSGAGEYRTFSEVVAAHADAAVIAVDMPIGLAETPPRPADLHAKRLLGRCGARVFVAPSRAAVHAPTYRAARRIQPSLSAQAWALAGKIREVEQHRDGRVIEVHPEVSFAELAGSPVAASKRGWNGQMERRRLIAAAGIALPDELPLHASAPDDVLDAAVAAWSAARYARGEAVPLPEGHTGRIGTIWR